MQRRTCEDSKNTSFDDANSSLLASYPEYAPHEGVMLDDVCSDFVVAKETSHRKVKLYVHVQERMLHVTLISASRDLDDAEWPRHVYSIGFLVYEPGERSITEDSDRLIDETGLVRLDESRVLRIESTASVFYTNIDEPYFYGCLYWYYANFTTRRFVLTQDGRLVRCEPTGDADRLMLSGYMGTTMLGYVELIPGQSQPYLARLSSNGSQSGIQHFNTLDEALAFLTFGTARF